MTPLQTKTTLLAVMRVQKTRTTASLRKKVRTTIVFEELIHVHACYRHFRGAEYSAYKDYYTGLNHTIKSASPAPARC